MHFLSKQAALPQKGKNRMKGKNIVLIGMPGCGKSTVGVVLAKTMGYRFTDADLVIQEQEGRLLSEIIRQEGLEQFLAIENRINAALSPQKTVIATGGSAVYGQEAMQHYRDTGIIVYIDLPYEEVAHRLGDLTKRGVAIHKGQTLHDLYEERKPLYEQWAHIIVPAAGMSLADTALYIKEKIEEFLSDR